MIKRNESSNAGTKTTFGQRMSNSSVSQDGQSRVDAEVWLKVGLLTNDPKYPIVTLPYGIPIDTQGHLNLGRGDNEYARFLMARNSLLDEIKTAADTLAPGEEMIIGGSEDGLILQLRRRSAEVAPIPAPETNDLLGGFKISRLNAA